MSQGHDNYARFGQGPNDEMLRNVTQLASMLNIMAANCLFGAGNINIIDVTANK